MVPGAGEVLHFSEDPTIEYFEPHVARTARQAEAYVWAVNARQAPAYWFPRDCPRAMAWPTRSTPAADATMLGSQAARVHVMEYAWLKRVQSVELWAYRLPAASFAPFGAAEEPHAMVSRKGVRPLEGPSRVPDLLRLHEDAGIELRLARRIWPFVELIGTTGLHLSVIRAANAQPG